MDRNEKLVALKEKWAKGMGTGIAFPQEVYDYIDGKRDFPQESEDYVVGRCYGYRDKLPKFIVKELNGDLKEEASRMLKVCALSRRNVGLVREADDIAAYRLAEVSYEVLLKSLSDKSSRIDAQTLGFAEALFANYQAQCSVTVEQTIASNKLASMSPDDIGYCFLTALCIQQKKLNLAGASTDDNALQATLEAEAVRNDNPYSSMAIAYACLGTSEVMRLRLKNILQQDASLAYRLYEETLGNDQELFADTIRTTGAPQWLTLFAPIYRFAISFVLNGNAEASTMTLLNDTYKDDKPLFLETYDNLRNSQNGAYEWLSFFLLAIILRNGDKTSDTSGIKHCIAHQAARLFSEEAQLTQQIESQTVDLGTWTTEMTKLKTWPPEARRSRFIFSPVSICALLSLDETADYVINGWLMRKKGKPLNEAQRQISACTISILHMLHGMSFDEVFTLMTSTINDFGYAEIIHTLLNGNKQMQSLLTPELLSAHKNEALCLLESNIGNKNATALRKLIPE